jgi:nucleotidyltransferase/DNA polymerase involved in DNA repair
VEKYVDGVSYLFFSIECCSTLYCVDIHFSVYAVIVKIAEELRKCVNEETGLTCSAGVAPNRLLAKVLLAIPLFRCSLRPAWTSHFASSHFFK